LDLTRLTEIAQASSGGDGPCHITVDRSGRQALVANYGGGSVASLPIGADGRAGEPGVFIQHVGSSANKSRQGEPHAHSVNLSPDGKFAFAADLGTDHIYVYGFDPAKGLVGPASPESPVQAPGSGPRHFAFHPSGKYAYAINEMLSTVTVFHYAAKTGGLHPLQTISTLPAGYPTEKTSTAEVLVHPNGKFVYGSNRGHDSIAIFKVDAATGQLALVGHEPTAAVQLPFAKPVAGETNSPFTLSFIRCCSITLLSIVDGLRLRGVARVGRPPSGDKAGTKIVELHKGRPR
jgi:6-phosphogluconolactonase